MQPWAFFHRRQENVWPRLLFISAVLTNESLGRRSANSPGIITAHVSLVSVIKSERRTSRLPRLLGPEFLGKPRELASAHQTCL